jgi:hypothetical protein
VASLIEGVRKIGEVLRGKSSSIRVGVCELKEEMKP